MFTIGTHIWVEKTGYTHHGIYIGSDKVIHYSGFHEFAKKGKISLTSLKEFSSNNKIYKYNTSLIIGDKYPDTEIVKRAKGRIEEDDYNLLFNNCEHFANWCTHGDDFSMQTSGTVEKNIRMGNYAQAGGLTLLDLISPLKSLFK